jgi:lipopolysaccharide biosynthesis protein
MNPTSRLGDLRVAVIAHVFYGDLWGEVATALRRIPIEFDLYVTVPEEHAVTLGSVIRCDFPHAEIVPTKNRGWDIGPFFKALFRAERSRNYTAICKIHTKKGKTHPRVWRQILFDSVLGSSALVVDILESFVDNPKLGLVGSKDLYFPILKYLGSNRENLEQIALALYPTREIPWRCGFFAGTMFWFRPSLFGPVSRLVTEGLAFEESTMRDGEIAHALERAFGLIAALSGAEIGLVVPSTGDLSPHLLQICSALAQPNSESITKYLQRRSEEPQFAAQQTIQLRP